MVAPGVLEVAVSVLEVVVQVNWPPPLTLNCGFVEKLPSAKSPSDAVIDCDSRVSARKLDVQKLTPGGNAVVRFTQPSKNPPVGIVPDGPVLGV
jgi:hypothetical protein